MQKERRKHTAGKNQESSICESQYEVPESRQEKTEKLFSLKGNVVEMMQVFNRKE